MGIIRRREEPGQTGLIIVPESTKGPSKPIQWGLRLQAPLAGSVAFEAQEGLHQFVRRGHRYQLCVSQIWDVRAYQDSNNYVQGWIYTKYNVFATYAVVGGVAQNRQNANLPAGFNPAHYHTIKVVKAGNTFTFYLDGSQMQQR